MIDSLIDSSPDDDDLILCEHYNCSHKQLMGLRNTSVNSFSFDKEMSVCF